MNKEKMLSYGYFLKELPPPFNSVSFGENSNSIVIPNKSTGKPVEYSIPKGRFSRRILQISHPYNFVRLVDHLYEPNNWKVIESHYKKSHYSHSKVVENPDAGKQVLNKNNRAIITNYSEFITSKLKATEIGYSHLHEVKIDISQYYNTIYTHSLTWAILGKERAKKLLKLGKAKKHEVDYLTYAFADTLDTLVRDCQDKQSIGIPTGPDTSHIIAEIIGVYIDSQLKEKFSTIKVIRYFDDFTIFTKSEEASQRVIKEIHKILSDLQLSINESKLKIKQHPFEFQDTWTNEINSILGKTITAKKLSAYFSTLFRLANSNPSKSNTYFLYAFRRFEKQNLELNGYDYTIYESLLFKSMLVEPYILESVSRILESNRAKVNKKKLRNVLINIIEKHVQLNHHYEVVWALWIFKQFNLKLPKELAVQTIKSENNFAILVLLDLDNSSLIEDYGLCKKDKKAIKEIVESDIDKNWLLHYEGSIIKSWFKTKATTFYDTLKNNNIEFYDTSAKIKTFKKTTKKKKVITNTTNTPSLVSNQEIEKTVEASMETKQGCSYKLMKILKCLHITIDKK